MNNLIKRVVLLILILMVLVMGINIFMSFKDINGNEYESDIINKSNAKTLEIYDNKITNLIGRRNSDNTAVIKIKNASNFNISNIILYYDELDKNNKVISDAKTNIDMTLSADEVVQVQFTPKGFTDTIEITGYNYIVEDSSVNVDLKNNEIEIYENDKYLENSKNYEVMSINKINNKKHDKEDLTFVMKIKNTSQKNLGNIVLKIAEIDKNKEVVKIDHIIYNSILKPNDEAEIATSLYTQPILPSGLEILSPTPKESNLAPCSVKDLIVFALSPLLKQIVASLSPASSNIFLAILDK